MTNTASDLAVIMVPVHQVLDLLRDRKDRTTHAYFEYVTRLAADIKVAGVRNPVKVTREGPNHRLVCGQTRTDAARRAGLAEIPAIVLDDGLTPTQLLVEEWIDNNLGERFDILAEADIFHELMRINGWSPAELCAHVPAAKPASVSKALSVCENLIGDLKDRLRIGEFGPRLGYALSRVPADRQAAVYETVKSQKVEVAEAHIATLLGGRKKPKAKPVTIRAAHGVVVTIPSGLPLDVVLGDLATLPEAVRRTQKLGLPLSAAPQLLRTPTTTA